MFPADQLDNPNTVMLSTFKNYLFKAKGVNTTIQPVSLILSSSFTHAQVPEKHTLVGRLGLTHATLHTIVYKIDN